MSFYPIKKEKFIFELKNPILKFFESFFHYTYKKWSSDICLIQVVEGYILQEPYFLQCKLYQSDNCLIKRLKKYPLLVDYYNLCIKIVQYNLQLIQKNCNSFKGWSEEQSREEERRRQREIGVVNK